MIISRRQIQNFECHNKLFFFSYLQFDLRFESFSSKTLGKIAASLEIFCHRFLNIKLRLTIQISKFFRRIIFQIFLVRQRQRKRPFQFLFWFFSVFRAPKCPLTQCFEKRYQRFRCHCNEVLLKNAQLCNKTSCCIATKSRLTFLFSARFFLSKNETFRIF